MSATLWRRRGFWVILGLTALLTTILVGCSSASPTAAPATTPAAAVRPSLPALQTAREYMQLGNSFVQQGNYAQAEAAFLRALEMEPGNPDYLANLGVTYYSMARFDDAIKTYQQALQKVPDDAQINYLLGATYLQLNRLDEAEKALLHANQADPNLGEPYYGLGVLYKLRNDRAKAISAFEKFLQIGPSQDPTAVNQAKAELEALKAGQ